MRVCVIRTGRVIDLIGVGVYFTVITAHGSGFATVGLFEQITYSRIVDDFQGSFEVTDGPIKVAHLHVKHAALGQENDRVHLVRESFKEPGVGPKGAVVISRLHSRSRSRLEFLGIIRQRLDGLPGAGESHLNAATRIQPLSGDAGDIARLNLTDLCTVASQDRFLPMGCMPCNPRRKGKVGTCPQGLIDEDIG